MVEHDDAHVEIHDEASHGDGPAIVWEVAMNGVRKVCVFPARHAQKHIIRNECKQTCDSRDENTEQDSALLESPGYSDSSAPNHSIPSVENYHYRAYFIGFFHLFFVIIQNGLSKRFECS